MDIKIVQYQLSNFPVKNFYNPKYLQLCWNGLVQICKHSYNYHIFSYLAHSILAIKFSYLEY
jgi:hypothetical protein